MTSDSPSAGADPGGPSPRRSGRRRLDRRTIAICVCIAVIAALGAALLTSVFVSDDSRASPNKVVLAPAGKVETGKVLRTGVEGFDGKRTELGAWAGKGAPVVVNFFSSTCTPCITEMPALERVHRSVPDVEFVGVDVQDQIEPGRQLIARTGITYPAVRDPSGDLLRNVGGAGLPTTLLLDGGGRVVDTHTGALSEAELRRLIDRKLALGRRVGQHRPGASSVIDAPLALAFTAGMLATVNPCGFVMLPAYLSYFLGIDRTHDGPPEAGVLRALLVGAVVSLGFVALFGVAGAIISWTSVGIYDYASWITIVIGAALVVAGIAFLLGWEPSVALPRLDKGGRDRGLWSMFVFGLSYAIASLSCTIGPFMTAVAGTFRRSNVVSGIAVFGAYALGMAVLLMTLTLTLALARQSLLRGLRRSLPYVQRAAGLIMVVTGAYLTWYGIYELRVQGGAQDGGGPVDTVFGLSGDLSTWLSDVGAVRIGLVLGLVAAVAALVALLRMKPPGPVDR